MPKNKEFIYQDDNDSKHRCKLVKDWKNKNKINFISWPACSPDLNPIENLWGLLKRHLRKQSFMNENELTNSILLFWEQLDYDVINNMINSMQTRIILVIESEDKWINY